MITIRLSPWLTSTGSNLAIGLMGVITSIVLSRNLGPSGRGQLAEAMLWPNLVLLIGGIVNTQTVVYFWAKKGIRASGDTTIGSSLTLSAILAMLLVPAALGVNWLVLGRLAKQSYHMANVYTLVIPISLLLSCVHPVFLAEKRFVAYWSFRLLYALVYLVGVIVLGATGIASPTLVVAVMLVGLCIQAIWTTLAFSKRFGLSLRSDTQIVKAMLSFGARMNLSALPNQLNLRLDQMVMSLMVPSHVLGWYAVAFSWASMLSFLGVGISSVMLTRSASIDASDVQTVGTLLRSFRVAVVALILLAGVAVIATPIGIPLLFGASFSPAIKPAVILCVASIFSNLNTICHEMIRGLGFPERGIRAELAGLSCTLVLLIFLLPSYGGIGAAITSLVSYTVVFVLLMDALSKQINIPIRACLVPSKAELLEVQQQILHRLPRLIYRGGH